MTCPDREVLSVYFDGELDSPWKEKLETHLETCGPCRARLEAYRLARETFAPGAIPGYAASMERVWNRVAPSFAKAAGPKKPTAGRRFWTASVRLPLPLAAAAGLALVLAVAALAALRIPRAASEPQLAGMHVQDLTPIQDMASLLSYLDSVDAPDMVIINLPNTTFKSADEPQMLRAADYTRAAVIVPRAAAEGEK
jgi:anti-sigma factor RsiW